MNPIDRYEVMLGPNTKQYWVYDNKEDVYIDPPATICGDEECIISDIKKNASWLQDKEYWIKDIDI